MVPLKTNADSSINNEAILQQEMKILQLNTSNRSDIPMKQVAPYEISGAL